MVALEVLTKRSTDKHTIHNDRTLRANIDKPMNKRITEGIARDILKSNQKKYPKISKYFAF